jgi:hypothetical protein
VASVTSICNLALAKVGQANKIISIDENSKAARALNTVYETVRDQCLRDHPWNFATARAQLAADVDSPAWGFTYAYTLPADFLRLLEISDVQSQDYLVEGGKVLTDATGPLNLRYIQRVTDPNRYDALFITMFATLLAATVSYELTQSKSLKDGLFEEYQAWRLSGKNIDGQENPPELLQDNSWLDARR